MVFLNFVKRIKILMICLFVGKIWTRWDWKRKFVNVVLEKKIIIEYRSVSINNLIAMWRPGNIAVGTACAVGTLAILRHGNPNFGFTI